MLFPLRPLRKIPAKTPDAQMVKTLMLFPCALCAKSQLRHRFLEAPYGLYVLIWAFESGAHSVY